jgi:hypothetical protein
MSTFQVHLFRTSYDGILDLSIIYFAITEAAVSLLLCGSREVSLSRVHHCPPPPIRARQGLFVLARKTVMLL